MGTVLVIWSTANIIGKIFYSFLGHHSSINVIIVYGASLAVAGLCIGLTPVLLSRDRMLVLSALVGFFFSVAGALLYSTIFTIVGFRRFSDAVGLSHPFKASGNLLGGPIAGILYASTGNYRSSFYLAGIIMFLSGALMVPSIVQSRRKSRLTSAPV